MVLAVEDTQTIEGRNSISHNNYDYWWENYHLPFALRIKTQWFILKEQWKFTEVNIEVK